MFTSLSIFKQGLLILSVPVLAQAAFIGILLNSMSENTVAQKWAVHTKDVIAKTEETYRLLLERYASVRNLIILHNPRDQKRVADEITRANDAAALLRRLVADNAPQQARVDEVVAHIREFSDLLARIELLASERKRDGAVPLLEEAGLSLGFLRGKMDAILEEESRLDRDRMNELRRSGAWHFWTLIVGGWRNSGIDHGPGRGVLRWGGEATSGLDR